MPTGSHNTALHRIQNLEGFKYSFKLTLREESFSLWCNVPGRVLSRFIFLILMFNINLFMAPAVCLKECR